MSKPNIRFIMKSGASFDVSLTDITVTKNTRTQQVTHIDCKWDPDRVEKPWLFLDLNEIAAIIELDGPK